MHGSTPNIIYVGTMSADVPPPPVGPIGPWGAGEGELKTQKIRGGLIRAHAKCGPLYRAQTCAHSVVESSRSAKAFLQGGPKISNFSPFPDFSPYISETIKNSVRVMSL